MAVHVKCLRWPEHKDREEIGARDEGDDKRETEDARLLAQALGEHGVLCAIGLPEDEDYEESGA